MKIKHQAKAIEILTKMQGIAEDKIDANSHRCGTTSGDEMDERLNDVFMCIDTALEAMNDIGNI